MGDINILFLIKAAILGVVEGVTEFLPVSSTGHLIIVGNIIGFNDISKEGFVKSFDMIIQLGAILAIIVLYFSKIKETLINLIPSNKVSFEESGLKFWLIVLVSCVPAGVLGILFNDKIEELFFNQYTVAIALIVGGVFMIVVENRYRKAKNRTTSINNVGVIQAVKIGLFQCLALVPGMSRSASTIMGGWISGLSTVAAAEFSFFLAIPVMVGVTLIKVLKGALKGLNINEMLALGTGFVVSFVIALIVVDKFIAFLKKKPMRIFAAYRFVFAGIVLISGFLGAFTK